MTRNYINYFKNENDIKRKVRGNRLLIDLQRFIFLTFLFGMKVSLHINYEKV